MSVWIRFRDWPLRAKVVALLATASLAPLGTATWISLSNASKDQYLHTEQLLQARAEMLVRRIDGFNTANLRIANLLALASPAALAQSQGTSPAAVQVRALVHAQLQFWTTIDPNIRGVALLDAAGAVVIGTEAALEGSSLARYSFIRSALAGTEQVSDVFLAELNGQSIPTIAYLAPIRAADSTVLGLAAIWVHATYFEKTLSEVNDQVGAGSFAILVDSLGIRIAHSSNPSVNYRPVQALPPETVASLVAERRFGDRTRELVDGAPPVSWLPAVSYRELPELGMFRVRALGGVWGQSVGQRSDARDWMVFYMVPELVLQAEISRILRSKLLFAVVIMILALGVGLLCAAAIVTPVRRLAVGARAIGAGDLDAQVSLDRKDELGELGATFNTMAGRIKEQAAALKRESEAQYHQLFQTLDEAFCTIEMIFDEAGRPIDFVYLLTNHAFEEQCGTRNLQGRRKSEACPELEDRWLQIYGRVATTGESVKFEDEAAGPEHVHYHVRAYRVGGPDSRRVAVLFNDITERKLAQERQRAQLESLRLLHQITCAIGEREDLPSINQVVLRAIEEQLPVDFACIGRHDAERHRLLIEGVGEHGLPLARQMGLQAEQYVDIGNNGLARCVRGQLVYEPDVSAVKFPFPQRLAAGGLRSVVFAPLLVESKVFGVLIAARREHGFSSAECEFLRQLSQHVALAAHHAQLYAALQSAYDELRETQQAALQQERLRALGQMASGIAHDINNAISPVTLYTDLLLESEKTLSDEGRGQLQIIQCAIQDVAATVARMREFYRVREPQLMLAPVEMNKVVQQVVELTRARWSAQPQQHGITIELITDLQPDLPTIMAAEGEIREALTNLIFNAVDAMPRGGVLTLRTGVPEPGKVLVEVRDTGVGMDDDSRRRCLEPFFTTKGERGTGLGLAMVYGAVKRHSAEIDIESAPGRGTCVRLVFGASDAAPLEDDNSPIAVPHGLRILVIDDDPVLLRSLREILEGDGHAVQTAGGGREGLALAAAALAAGQQFSVVFTDLGMPHVDGRQVARQIRVMFPQTPIVMLTGWGERLIGEGDEPPEVDLVLSKPPKLRTLRQALAKLCA